MTVSEWRSGTPALNKSWNSANITANWSRLGDECIENGSIVVDIICSSRNPQGSLSWTCSDLMGFQSWWWWRRWWLWYLPWCRWWKHDCWHAIHKRKQSALEHFPQPSHFGMIHDIILISSWFMMSQHIDTVILAYVTYVWSHHDNKVDEQMIPAFRLKRKGQQLFNKPGTLFVIQQTRICRPGSLFDQTLKSNKRSFLVFANSRRDPYATY